MAVLRFSTLLLLEMRVYYLYRSFSAGGSFSTTWHSQARRAIMIASVTQRRIFLVGRLIPVAWMVGLVLGVPWVHAQAASGARGAADLTVAIRQVAKQTIPAVVHIEVTERQEVANPFGSFGSDPFFQ